MNHQAHVQDASALTLEGVCCYIAAAAFRQWDENDNPKCGFSVFVVKLCLRLSGSTCRTRNRAIQRCSQLSALLSTLCQRLKDTFWRVRYRAAQSLSSSAPHPNVVNALLELEHDDEGVCYAHVSGLLLKNDSHATGFAVRPWIRDNGHLEQDAVLVDLNTLDEEMQV